MAIIGGVLLPFAVRPPQRLGGIVEEGLLRLTLFGLLDGDARRELGGLLLLLAELLEHLR